MLGLAGNGSRGQRPSLNKANHLNFVMLPLRESRISLAVSTAANHAAFTQLFRQKELMHTLSKNMKQTD